MIDLIDKITGIDRNELDEQEMRNYKKIKTVIKAYIALTVYALVSTIFLLCSCSTTRYVPVENVRTEYKDRVVTVHDTVRDSVRTHNYTFQKDSMAMAMSGDTVKIEHWHTLKLIYYEKAKNEASTSAIDSASSVRVDSVRVPYPVERKLTKWEKTKMDFGTAAIVIAAIAIIAGIVFAVWWIRKRIRGNLKE